MHSRTAAAIPFSFVPRSATKLFSVLVIGPVECFERVFSILYPVKRWCLPEIPNSSTKCHSPIFARAPRLCIATAAHAPATGREGRPNSRQVAAAGRYASRGREGERQLRWLPDIRSSEASLQKPI